MSYAACDYSVLIAKTACIFRVLNIFFVGIVIVIAHIYLYYAHSLRINPKKYSSGQKSGVNRSYRPLYLQQNN